MFSLRFISTIIVFIFIISLWANAYFKHHPKERNLQTKDTIYMFDKKHPLAFHLLTTTGEPSPDGNGEVFAAVKDANGKTIEDYEQGSKEPYICHNGAGPDHSSLLQKDGELFSITHLECFIGGAYISKLTQNKQGLLHVDWFKSIDFSSVGGTAVGCAGVTTPWQSHLGSEEYENDMAQASLKNRSIKGAHKYLNLKATHQTIQRLGYNHGWITEITPTDTRGSTQVLKHYAMGRFSHELAFVMPDEKTLYLSDDGTNGAFFMFIADRKRDFSSGSLYAAKWNQTGTKDELANLSWINLGHANEKQIKSYLAQTPDFHDLFEKKPYENGCEAGFKAVNTAKTGVECLRLKKDKALLASRLESRRYAAYRGATSELKKAEGITYNKLTNELYLSISVVSSGMEDFAKRGNKNPQYDQGTSNDIKLPYNPCGMILKMSLEKSALLDSSFVATKVSKLIEGSPKFYPRPTNEQFNSCDITTIANPDNISHLENSPYLAIGEDSKGHEKDRLWLLNTQTQTLQELAVAPFGAEFTSTYWHKDIQGFTYLFSVIQHPFGEKDWLVDHTNRTKEDKRSKVGYFGPFKF